MATIGRNISFPIYNGDGTSFHDLVMKRATYDSIVMSLGDKITGDVYYKDNTLVTNQDIYIVYNGVHYTLVNPPTIVREGMASENGELKGMTKYSFEFYHPMYQLNNFPFSDIAVTSSQGKYLSQNKTFAWIGDLYDYVDKINVNLEETVWCCEIGSSVQEVDKAKLSDVLSFNNQTIADALKTGYETWEIPYVISQLPSTDTRYSRDGKRFLITFGLPSTEIIGANNQPYVFRFGQGVGLKNNSRTPRNNKIVTRLAGYGSENNIPWGYPQIIWTGDASWNYTIGNDPTDPNSYPIYDGIVNGERVRLIKHPFTRNHLMPSIYAETVNRKVNPNARGYDPDTVIIDYYDADDEEEFENIINSDAPSYEIHEFEDIKPELGEQYLVDVSAYDANAITLSECKSMVLDYYSESNIEAEKTQLLALYNALPNTASSSGSSGVYKYDWSIANDGDYLLVKYKSSGVNFEHKVTRQVTPDWDDSIDDDGNYKQSYFKVTLPELGFDLYACAALTEKMQINMRSGDCIGCTFDVMIDWDDYKKNFYTEDGKFDPVIGTGHPRNGTKYPDSTNDEITLIVQKDNNTFGIIMPNIYQQPTSRDKFVILGISLPLAYITDAEERLDADMIQYMKDNNVFYFDYPLKFDENFLYRNTDILAQMKPNVIVRFEYAGIVNALYIKQMSIKYGQGVLPQYDITLTDDVEIVLNKIGQVTDEVSKLRLMMGEGGDANVAELDKRYLSKRNDDTAEGMIRMTKGLYVGNNFVTGLLGEGGVMRMDNDGTTYLEVDKMYVRMRAYFDTVEVRRFLHSGGNRIASLAGMKCTRVEYINSSGNVTKDASSAVKFRCYFRANDDGNAVTNDFVVGDLAFCKETNAKVGQGVEQHGYWRAVVDVSTNPNSNGEHWIDLSAVDCLSGSDIPIAQDDIIQLGNQTDTTRQGAIIEYVGGDDAPAYQIYQGINTYSLNDKNYVRFGYDSQSGGAQAYIGNPNGSTYLWYHNVTEGGVPIQRLDIKANVKFTSPTTQEETNIQDFAQSVVNEMADLQSQIDGEIDTWFYAGTPTLNNLPASEWNSDDEKDRHLGDLYYDIGTGQTAGFAYRFIKNLNDVYEWQYLEDTAITEALAAAARAQDTADHKRRVFLSTPTTPYDAGDLWAQGENGDLFRCTTSRQSGNYVASDWELATKYTDDTKYNSFITRLLNGMPSGSDETSVTNALNAIKGAYNQGTEVHGGLVLTSLIGLLDSNGDTQAGISGQYSSTAFGNGLAFWAGGGMIDKRNSSTGAYDVADGAKIGLRFDGSGYVANGNLFWNANGDVNIQGYSINATTLQVGGKGVATTEALANYLPLAGGTMKGDIKVDANNSRTLGESTKRWKNIYSISAVVKNASTNNDGSFIEIGQIRLVYDHNNNALKVVKNDGTSNANFYATGTVSALGANSQGGGGGADIDAVWDSLTGNGGEYADTKINIAHIPDLSNLTLSYGKSGAVTSSVVYNGKAGKTVYIPQKLSDLSDGANIVTNVAVGTSTHANELAITKNGETSYITVPYATKSTQWNTARSFTIKDSDSTNSGTAASVNGTAAVTLLLPSTIKATLKGNADTATTATKTNALAQTTAPDDMGSFYDSNGYFIYTAKSDASGTTTDTPVQNSFGALAMRVASTYYMQLFMSVEGGIFTRVGTSSTLSGGTWREIAYKDTKVDSAVTADKLNTGTTEYTAWGQKYWQNGVPNSISGNISSAGNITPSDTNSKNLGSTSLYWNNLYVKAITASTSIKIGTIVLTDDKGMLKVWDGTGNAVKGIYATGTVSALGANTSGGGGTGIEMPQVWEALAQAGSGEPINITHLQAALTRNGYMHSFSKTSPTGANVVTDVNYNSSTGTLSVTRGSLAMNALAPRDIPSTLATFYDGDNLIYTRAGGNNTVEDKPVNVDSFGVITMRTAAGYYGQILYSTADGNIYYRSAATSSLGGTSWNTLLGTLNYKSYTYDKTATYNRNMVLASSASADGNAATFRLLDAADIPSLPADKIGSGTFDKARIPDLSSLYVPISAKWWGQSISNGAVSGNMSNVGTVTFNKSTGNRQLIISPVIGMTMNASTGGWVMSMGTKNNAGTTDLEQIGILGSADTITYSYVGGTYVSPSLVVLGNAYASGTTSQEGFVGIGTKTPSARLHVNGKTRISYDGASGNENLTLQSSNTDATYNCMSYIKVGTNGVNWSAGINANGYYLWSGQSGVGQCFLVTNDGQTQVKSLKIGTITLTDDNGLLRIDKGVYSLGTVSALGANNDSSGGGGVDIVDVWDALARPDSSKLIDSSHINISVSGNGNAVTAVTNSGTSITLNKGISFLPLTGNNAANTPVTGDVNFDNGISLKWKKSSGSTAYSVLCLNGSNQLMLGLATAWQSCDTKIYGNNIYLNYGVSGTTGITLASGGNVTIANNLTVSGNNGVTASKFVKSGAAAANFLKANGDDAALTANDIPDLGNVYAKKADAVTALGVSGNNLTWTKNGETNTITVPFATNATRLNGNASTWYMKRGVGYTSNLQTTTTTCWLKVASATVESSGTIDASITLAVTEYYIRNGTGILVVNCRRNSGASEINLDKTKAYWISRDSNINLGDFALTRKNVASNKVTFNLYVKKYGQYKVSRFTMIDEGDWYAKTNVWTLYTSKPPVDNDLCFSSLPSDELITINGTPTAIYSTDESYASNAGMLNGVAASGYVTIAGTQKITGVKTFDANTLVVDGNHVSDGVNKSTIRFSTMGDNSYKNAAGTAAYAQNSGIRNCIRFDWYDTAWAIGNVRGGGYDSQGFAIGYMNSGKDGVLHRFLIQTNGDILTNASITAGSEVTASSDERLKTINGGTNLTIKDIASAPSIRFTWNDKRDEKVHIGSIAQYWKKALPEAVSYDEKGIMSLNYGALALVSAITIARGLMKHEDEITRLKKEVVMLREMVAELEERRIA